MIRNIYSSLISLIFRSVDNVNPLVERSSMAASQNFNFVENKNSRHLMQSDYFRSNEKIKK